jgi:hypothetical protein
VQACRRSLLPGETNVTVAVSPEGRGTIVGVRTCGSVWACPLCAGVAWQQRAEELAHCLRVAQAQGLRVAMVTLTQRHRKGQSLAELWDALCPALHAALGAGSRAVRRLRDELGVVGIVRRIEATHGASGWHLHPHILVFAECADDQDFDRLGDAMFETWRAQLVRRGLEAPTRLHGFNVKPLPLDLAGESAARYVTSAGSFHAAAELADRGGKSARYGNRTTWELLGDARNGDRRAAALWREWEQASRGKRALVWSTEIRQLAAENTERVVEMERAAPTPIGALTEREWVRLCAHRSGPGGLLAAVTAAYRDAIRGGAPEVEALGDAAICMDVLVIAWAIRGGPA